MSPDPRPQSRENPAAARRQSKGGRRGKKRDMGRAEWSRTSVDKRARNEESQRSAKRQKVKEGGNVPVYATKYTAEEIAAEERQPKRKVAVLIGYSGTGYKGMQLNHQEKTIEGDLFRAFVAAGAISKANADDAKKSSLVRCARTDKGVHAAGNVISLKLVVEDENIISKINQNLPPQIRVWGIERTNKSFSAYQVCDSRVYEYLIPTYCFLPPHPQSFLGKNLIQLAEEENDLDGYQTRQAEVSHFWEKAHSQYLQPIIDSIDPSIRSLVLDQVNGVGPPKDALTAVSDIHTTTTNNEIQASDASVAPSSVQRPDATNSLNGSSREGAAIYSTERTESANVKTLRVVDEQVKALKAAEAAAKRAWRIPISRLERIRSIFSRFVGSIKYHNYTVDKTWQDPSAMRVIKSFTVDDPITIGDTEWLSLKVHGQSFMMHQIRKMVSGATMIVRCGCHEGRIQDTFLRDRISIPKAPSLGLLLERPVFDKYNEKLVELGREPIDFGKHEKAIADFKQKEIYDQIFRVEDSNGIFLSFFAGLDGGKSPSLLWLTSTGLQATKREIAADDKRQSTAPDHILLSDDEDECSGQEEN